MSSVAIRGTGGVKHIRRSAGERAASAIIHVVMILFSASCVIPLLLTLVVSFSSESSVIRYGFQFIPKQWSTLSYQMIFADSQIFRAYGVTIFITVIGTVCAVVLVGMAAYSMSLAKVKYRNRFAMFFYIPMVFNAGLVPWYMICTKVLHFQNQLYGLIALGLISPFNIFLMRNFFKTIPESLSESAQIDGAGAMRTFLQIVLPLSGPIIATVALFVSLSYWNNYTNALWFITNRSLYPLQYFLYRIKQMMDFIQQNGLTSAIQMPTQTFQIAMLFVTIGPIVLAYPFAQRFFIKGILIGAVKG